MIYVDALRWRLDPRTLRRKRWAHMIATEGLDELHTAALSLGLRREWAQDVHTAPCPASECRAGRIPAARRSGGACLCCGGSGAVEVPGRLPHYDLRPRSHARALASGATLVSPRELVRYLRERRDGRSTGPPTSPS